MKSQACQTTGLGKLGKSEVLKLLQTPSTATTEVAPVSIMSGKRLSFPVEWGLELTVTWNLKTGTAQTRNQDSHQKRLELKHAL